MAKKFTIAQNATFKKRVMIPRVGGDAVEVEFEFKYLPRKELAKVYEGWRADREEKMKDLSEETSLTDITELEVEIQTKQLADILVGWGFDDAFDEDSIQALVESSVHVFDAVLGAYHTSYSDVKLGN